jgi:uncharacterized protein (DUF924 family)
MRDDLADLDRRITDAMTALRCARAVAQHSADSKTRWQEEMAERTLNGLLDQRPRSAMNERPKTLAAPSVAPRFHW